MRPNSYQPIQLTGIKQLGNSKLILLNNKIICLKGTLISLFLVSGQNIELDDEVGPSY